MAGMADGGLVSRAARRPDGLDPGAPGSAAQDAVAAAGLLPAGAVRGRRLIGGVPAIRDPLRDAAAHVEEPERVLRRAPDAERGVRVVGLPAAAAIDHPGDHGVAPPVAA